MAQIVAFEMLGLETGIKISKLPKAEPFQEVAHHEKKTKKIFLTSTGRQRSLSELV